MPNRLTVGLMYLASGLILVAAALHGIVGFSAIEAELVRLEASEEFIGALGLGWTLGSLCGAALGLITLLAARRLARGDASLRSSTLLIGVLYGLFGVGATVVRGVSPHFLLFIGIGGLLVAALWRPNATV